MHILIAMNAFKNSLTAGEAAQAVARGLQQSALHCSYENFPVGDGGDGTGALLVERCGGRNVPLQVLDPFGRKIAGTLGLIDEGRTAVIELADASGLRRVHPNELNPLRATTFGTGQAMRQALDLGVDKIVLGIGGSATVDGAAGLLQALGARFLDALGQPLTSLPESLVDLHAIDLDGLDPRLARCEIVVMCDVDNPLLGRFGSAAVFGPQKGASPAEVQKLEAALTKLSVVLQRETGRDIAEVMHGGAAGGVAAGLHGALNAQLVNGIEYFLDAAGFDANLQHADLVITGEGSLDEQTLQGKAPYGVALRAKAKHIPVIGLAGKIPGDVPEELQRFFSVLLSIGAGPVDLAVAMRRTAEDLQRTASQLGNALALHFNKITRVQH